MVVDFSKIDYKKIPTLVLRNLSMEPIGIIRNAIDLSAELHYNETSSLSFTVPSVIDGVRSETYDKIKGMQIIDWVDVGQFLLVNPRVSNDGIREVKEVKLYSLEYEFTFKLMNLSGGTYKFYDAVENKDTIMGIIMEKMPSWSIGEIDEALWNKYRTFDDITNTNVYNFIKSNVQQSYQCIFDFDTYERKVNVRSVDSVLTPKPVYLSLRNLIKNIDVSEDTESVVTCSTVEGADGVDIISVNPLGTRKIYNLDYFMTEDNFSQEMLNKWAAWKSKCDGYLETYYNLTVSQSLKTQEYASVGLNIGTLDGELTKLENEQVVIIKGVADGGFTQERLTEINAAIQAKKSEIETAKSKQGKVYEEIYGDGGILAQQTEINKDCSFENNFTSDELLVLDRYFIEQPISEASFVMSDIGIYDAVSAGGALAPLIYFSGVDIAAVEDTDHTTYTFSVKDYSYFEIQDSSFPVTGVLKSASVVYYPVARTATITVALGSGYCGSGDTKSEFAEATIAFNGDVKCSLMDTDATMAGITGTYMKLYMADATLNLATSDAEKSASYATYGDMEIKDSVISQTTSGDITYVGMTGGSFSLILNSTVMTGEIVNGTVSYENVAEGLTFTAYLANGFVGGAAFSNATITVVGSASSVVTDTTSDLLTDGKNILFNELCGTYFFTQSVSEYAKRSTERELYDYGVTALNKLACPSYSFEVDSANFLATEDFDLFKRALRLGEKAYVEFSNGKVMTPIVIGASLDMDNAASLTIEFGDKYSSSAGEFLYEDLLEQSVSTSRDVSLKNWTYSAFVDSGAQNSVRDYMTSAQDFAKQAIMSSGEQAITIDDAGIRLRKYSDTLHTSYDDCQIWMNNNTILFTDDNWATAKVAIGQFNDSNTGKSMGIVAPSIAGTLLAGEELVIESSKQDGGVAVFKMDADGASLHNSKFNLYGSTGARIELNPDMGILAGDLNNAFEYDDETGTISGVKTKSTSTSEYGDTITKLSQLTDGYAPQTNLWMDMNGDIFLKGTVYATDGEFSGKLSATTGAIGKWTIDANGLIYGEATIPEYYLGPTGISATIGGQTRNDWIFKAGSYFGVTSSGVLYAKDMVLSAGTSSGDSYFYVNSDGSSIIRASVISGAAITAGTIDGAEITGVSLKSGTIEGSTISGSSFECNSAGGYARLSAGGIYFGYYSQGVSPTESLRIIAQGSETMFWAMPGADVAIRSTSGDIKIVPDDSHTLTLFNAITGYSSLRPVADNTLTLGMSNYRWGQIYSTTSTIETSDRTEKEAISYDLDRYEALFDTLKPCSYKFINGTSDRTHTGFIAQDVEEGLSTVGLDSRDFAAFIKSPEYDDDGNLVRNRYGLRYGEFVALNTYMIKKLQARVKELEATIDSLA